MLLFLYQRQGKGDKSNKMEIKSHKSLPFLAWGLDFWKTKIDECYWSTDRKQKLDNWTINIFHGFVLVSNEIWTERVFHENWYLFLIHWSHWLFVVTLGTRTYLTLIFPKSSGFHATVHSIFLVSVFWPGTCLSTVRAIAVWEYRLTIT